MRALLVFMCAWLTACGGAPARPTTPTADKAAGWSETLRLIDLFDAARARHDAAMKKELLAALGVPDDPDARDRTTDAAIDALLVRVDAILAADRLHAGAQAARTLLELDGRPAASRAELFPRMAAWKGIARGGGPLAANAILRLWSFCSAAFHDAAGAPARDRPAMLSMCLYPLFDSDPEPYFAADPTRRPPPPAWADLWAGMNELATSLQRQERSRLAELATPLRAELDALIKEADGKDLLPRTLDPRAMAVPFVADPPVAAPYDAEPLVFVHDPSADELKKFEQQLGALLASDGRGRAALALRGETAARYLLEMAELLRRLGAESVEIAVGWEQQLKPPAGDYWHGRAPGGRAVRLGVLPLRLDAARLGPRAGLGLVLAVGPRSWRIVAPTGALPEIPVGADAGPARAALREQLRMLFDAFPDEGALAVAPAPTATIAAVAAAVAAAGRAADGAPLAELALAAPGKLPESGGDLAERARRRASARVKLVPDALAPREAAVRRCYLDALDRAPSLAGTLALELGGGAVKVMAGPEDARLRACVLSRLDKAIIEGAIRSVRVELSR